MNQEEMFEYSKKIVPGGVHSPVRSFKGLESSPRFIKKSFGAEFIDIQGKKYIDFCMGFGPLILGHCNKKVENDLKIALENGWCYGSCEPYSLKLVNLMLEKIPHIEQVRFVNSGTEAVMTAIRLARGYTKKNKIIKFNGCYHGHVDSMLIKAGSGLAGTSTASSAGIPKGVYEDTLILDLNDLDQVQKCFSEHKNSIAALIIEPLPANNGLLIQEQSYLEALSNICKENNSLLIFDEVISGFRVGIGAMAKKTSIKPDITTYGKIIGGGLPVGAVASSKKIMSHLAPVGDVYQAGTLSANPLAMIGGFSTISQLTDQTYQTLKTNTQNIVSIFSKWLSEFQNQQFKDFQVIQYESLFWIAPKTKKPIRSLVNIPENIATSYKPLFETLLSKGIYLAPNAYEVSFVSTAHNKEIQKELENKLWSQS